MRRGGVSFPIGEVSNLCISSDDSRHLLCKDRISLVALPFLHVVRKGDADAFCLVVVGRIYSTSIVEHHESGAKSFSAVLIDKTFILNELLPPLSILVVDVHERLLKGTPFMSNSVAILCPCLTEEERSTDTFITRSFSSEVCHPVSVLVFRHLVATVPLPVDEGGEAATLVHIPSAVFIVKETAEGVPVKEVSTLC